MIYFNNAGAIDCGSKTATSRFNSSNFTLAAWVVRYGAGTNVSCGTNGQTAIEPIFTHGIGESETRGSNLNWFLGYVPASGRFGADFEDFKVGLNHPFNFSGATVVTGQAYHVAVTYNTGIGTGSSTGYWSGYLNGVLNSVLAVVGDSGTRMPDHVSIQGVGIGTALNTGQTRAGGWRGLIWDCAMWNECLTSGEVYALATSKMAYMPLQIRPSNLKAYFPLDETRESGVVSTTSFAIIDRAFPSGATMFAVATGKANNILSYY